MGEWRYSSTILDLGIRWRLVVSFTPLLLYPRGKSPGTLWIGGWVGPRVGLDAVEKKKILLPRESNPGRPARGYTNSTHGGTTAYSLFGMSMECMQTIQQGKAIASLSIGLQQWFSNVLPLSPP
jgi:hypothetical protein